mgnify:CR=1 FL=1
MLSSVSSAALVLRRDGLHRLALRGEAFLRADAVLESDRRVPRRPLLRFRVQDGDADLIAIGRQALYDPFWPVHAAQELGCDEKFQMWNPEYGWWLDKRRNNLPPERAATGHVK